MAAITRAPTTIVGGHGRGAELSAFTSLVSPPYVLTRPANDNAPIRWSKAVGMAVATVLTVTTWALLLVRLL
jgi:hypothetical protein